MVLLHPWMRILSFGVAPMSRNTRTTIERPGSDIFLNSSGLGENRPLGWRHCERIYIEVRFPGQIAGASMLISP